MQGAADRRVHRPIDRRVHGTAARRVHRTVHWPWVTRRQARTGARAGVRAEAAVRAQAGAVVALQEISEEFGLRGVHANHDAWLPHRLFE
jgi:hypothetical protein